MRASTLNRAGEEHGQRQSHRAAGVHDPMLSLRTTPSGLCAPPENCLRGVGTLPDGSLPGLSLALPALSAAKVVVEGTALRAERGWAPSSRRYFGLPPGQGRLVRTSRRKSAEGRKWADRPIGEGPRAATNADRGAGVANSLAKLSHFSCTLTGLFDHVILAGVELERLSSFKHIAF